MGGILIGDVDYMTMRQMLEKDLDRKINFY